MGKILEINSSENSLKIELREDFKYIDDNEEEQMKMLNQDYLGSGYYSIKYENFVKLCIKSQNGQKLEEFKIDAPK